MTHITVQLASSVHQPPLLLAGEQVPEHCTDCACAERPFAVAFAGAGAAAPHVRTGDAFACDLPQGFHAVMSAWAPAGPSVVNPAGWERWQEFAAPQPLAQEFDHLLAGQGLVRPVGATPIPQETRAETLIAWLHVTNACNLDCPYCYVRKSAHAMSAATGARAVRALFAAAAQEGFHTVKLKYAGGEASLHFGLVRALHDLAAAEAHARRIGLDEVLLTNGTLLRAADAEWCRAAGVRLMVSVDGVGALHDQLRPWRKGGDSFAQVQRTVDEVLLPRGLRPCISMTVTGANAHGAADVVRWAMVERGLPLNLNFYRATPLAAARADLELDEARIVAGLLAAYAAIEAQLPAAPFLDGLLDRGAAHAHTHTCGAGHNYVVIDHTGRVSQCQMHLGDGAPLAGEESLLPLLARGPVVNLAVDQKAGCRACEFRYRCTGGCPVETFRATGRWDVQSPNCAIYRTLWPAALRLEGLRLMKVHGYLN